MSDADEARNRKGWQKTASAVYRPTTDQPAWRLTLLFSYSQAVPALFLAVVALHQFGMAGGAAPVALDAGARIAQRHLLQFVLPVQVLGHVAALFRLVMGGVFAIHPLANHRSASLLFNEGLAPGRWCYGRVLRPGG